jgi:hypothetical protein
MWLNVNFGNVFVLAPVQRFDTQAVTLLLSIGCLPYGPLRRLAGGLAWLGFLTFGTLGEQIKTRLEVDFSTLPKSTGNSKPMLSPHCLKHAVTLQVANEEAGKREVR